jgi:hypothetical protein
LNVINKFWNFFENKININKISILAYLLKIEQNYNLKNNNIFINKKFTKIVNLNQIQTILLKLKSFILIIMFNVRWLIIAVVVSTLYFFISIFYIQIDFTKQISAWYLLLIIYYLLMSTFNTFLNKYRYGKFTSAIQRFWKRTGMVFWLIEGFLFLIFFYYFLNSSQEPLYMFDYSSLNQELLVQLKTSYKNTILLSLAIYICFVMTINNNYLNYYQNILFLTIVSLIVFYMLFIESYQFAYIINLFATKNWIFDELQQIWVLELETNNLRTKQQYFVLCLVAKYWHFIFIFISWFFFLIKTIESGKINYTFMSYNIQNLLILYILNIFCLIQWLKWLTKKFLEITYYWFHIQYDEKFIINFSNEFISTLLSLFRLNNSTNSILYSVKLFSNSLLYTSDFLLWKYV